MLAHSSKHHIKDSWLSLRSWRCQNLLIMMACSLVILMMAIAYAALGTTLSIKGQVTIKSNQPIRITSVKPLELPEVCEAPPYLPTWDDTAFQVDGKLSAPDCEVAFDITVRNETNDIVYIKNVIEDSFSNPIYMKYVFSIRPSTSQAIIEPLGQMVFTMTVVYGNRMAVPPAFQSFTASLRLAFEKAAPPVLAVANDSRNFEIFRGQTVFTPAAMTARVSALDDMDDDITANITPSCQSAGGTAIACPTAWSELSRGDYKITYNVSNSLGMAAAPVTMNVRLWDFVKLEGGTYHEVALTSHGQVYTWGNGSNYRHGLGDNDNRRFPVFHTGLEGINVVDVTACDNSGHAVDSDGNLYSWGSGSSYSLGTGSTSTRQKPFIISPPSGEKYTKVSCFNDTGAALTDAGYVYTWGEGNWGVNGHGSSTNIRVPTRLPNLSNIVTVNMGYYNGGAIDASGKLFLWGTNNEGQLGVGATEAVPSLGVVQYYNKPGNYNGITDAKDICFGRYHAVLVKTNGQVQTWGRNNHGQLGNGGSGSSTNMYTPYNTSITNGASCDAHEESSAVLSSNGQGYFFGSNNYGQAGTGSTTPSSVTSPLLSSISDNITDIALQMSTGHVLVDGIKVYGFGYGGNGALGAGSSGSTATPVAWSLAVPDISEW